MKNNCGEVLTQSWKKNLSRREKVKRQFRRNAGFARLGRVDGVQSVQQKGERRSFDFRGARFEFENEENALCVVEILGCLVNLSDQAYKFCPKSKSESEAKRKIFFEKIAKRSEAKKKSKKAKKSEFFFKTAKRSEFRYSEKIAKRISL